MHVHTEGACCCDSFLLVNINNTFHTFGRWTSSSLIAPSNVDTGQCEQAMQNLKLECEQYNHDCVIRQSKNFQQHPVEILQEDWHRRKKTADSRPQTWNLSKDSESAVLEAKKHDKNRHFTPYWLICQKSAKMHVPINSTCFFTLYCMGFSVTQKKGCTVSAIIYTLNAYITRNYADSVEITP